MKQHHKGSYTVEASLLSAIVIPVLIAVLYLGFYLHDEGIVQGAAHEAACAVSLHAGDDKKPGDKVAKALITNRLLAARGVAVQVADGEKKVKVHYQGSLPVPGISTLFFSKNRLHVESEVDLLTQSPSATIQKIRGAIKIVERIRGE